MKNSKVFFFIIILLIYSSSPVFPLEKETHKAINIHIAQNTISGFSLNNYLIQQLGFEKGVDEELIVDSKKKKVFQWLGEGGFQEDIPEQIWRLVLNMARNNNHFHNPLETTWDNAGLDDYIGPLHYTGQSLLLWAQNPNQSPGGKWSWQDARTYYYNALTATNKDGREKNFADTFRAVGQQMHLVQDASAPEHVRNDIHISAAYEAQIELFRTEKKYDSLWSSLIASPITYNKAILDIASNHPTAKIPIARIIDADLYTGNNPDISKTTGADPQNPDPQYIGIAEYANVNFASDDITDGTIFTEDRPTSDNHYFPYPRKSSTNLQELISKNILPETVTAEDGIQESTLFIKKERDGEFIEHFVKPRYTTTSRWDLVGGGAVYALDFYLDEECYEHYAQKLIPRAVGYSAGLLNYFFRGALEISAPDSYVYSISDGSEIPQQFTKIKAKVMNTTQDEDIQNGVIQAVAKYKKRTNYQPDLSAEPPTAESREANFSYSVSEPITLTSEEIASINIQPEEFTFDFTDSPIPAGITDLYLQIIFKGTLGNETDNAIAVGIKDLKEPTHHVFWNLTDMFSLLYEKDGVYKYHLHTSDQIKADSYLASLVDLNHNGIFNEDNEPYIDPYPITYEITYMAESSPIEPVYTSASVGDLPAGRYIRLIVLVDDEQMDNYGRLAWLTTLPDRDPEVGDNDFIFGGVTNQEIDGVWQPPTPIITFRTVKQHFYTGILNCYPVVVDPSTGVHHCPYPEEEAIAADPTPYPVVINFP
ncbi:MAG: hypothetical protein AB1480_05100 [Nitrospirota bacterium]